VGSYLNHQAEVRAYLRQQHKEAQETWELIESKADYQAFRERLLARYQAKTSPAK